MKRPHPHRLPGFNLVELLVAILIVAVLAAVASGMLSGARMRAIEARDLSRMRGLGIALYGWASEHQGHLPRSSHSAFGRRELGWQREILPHLGFSDTGRDTLALVRAEQFGIDETEDRVRSPGLNVYFELDPEYDDYLGAPKTWRNPGLVPSPESTILLVMAYGSADHVMAQYFNGCVSDCPAPRPERDLGCVLWVDGHASLERPDAMFDSAKGIDHFHPDHSR